jgi:REP element-mobilizing transposase RayT
MGKENNLPKRKPTRLNGFDYSTYGAYFVTICAENRAQIFSEIVKTKDMATDEASISPVGEGLAPPEYIVKLKPCGEVVREQLLLLEDRFPTVTVEDFVIMPDHMHAILCLHMGAGGASPSPTMNDVICAFKSLTTRICKQRLGIEKVFQRSYADHIVRDQEDYETRRK